VRSQDDLKVPGKLIDVKNISISTENRISKSVYYYRPTFEPFRIPNSKQKQSSPSSMFCQISPIPNHFNRNRNWNRFVTVTFEFVTTGICNICDKNVTKSVLLKKLQKKTERVTKVKNSNCDILWPLQMSNHWLVQTLFLFLFAVRIMAQGVNSVTPAFLGYRDPLSILNKNSTLKGNGRDTFLDPTRLIQSNTRLLVQWSI